MSAGIVVHQITLNYVKFHNSSLDEVPIRMHLNICTSQGLGLEALMPGCWQDWSGLEGVAARSGEGIRRNSNTLDAQEVGGLIEKPLGILLSGRHQF